MKEKKSIKKLVAFFGTVLAIMALMCTAAFAEISNTDKAAIGGTGYATFEDAVNAAKNGDTITLLADAEVDRSEFNTYAIYYRITVDGQNKYGLKINGTGSVEIQVEVRFKNMVINDTATHYYGIFKITGSGHLVLENSTVTGAVGGVAGPIVSESKDARVTLIGSKIDSSKSSWNNNKGTAVSMSKGGKLVIDAGSEITGCQNGSEAVAVYGGTGSIEVSGRITGNKVTDGAVYAGSGVTVTIGENAEISGNAANLIAVKADDENAVTDNSLKYGKFGNSCYEESAVVISDSGTAYSDIYNSLKNAGTMYLLKDGVFTRKDGDTDKGNLDKSISVTLDGQNNTVTFETGTAVAQNITFTNVTLDISNLSGDAFSIWGGSVTLESGANVTGNGQAAAGERRFVTANANTTFNMKEGSSVSGVINSTALGGAVQLKGGTFNMTGGTINGCKANAGGAVYIRDGGKMVMSGGEIKNNSSNWPQGGGIFIENGTLTVSGDATVDGNAQTGANNIYGSAASIIVSGEFSGKIGIRIADSSVKADAEVATAAEGASLATTGTVICDNGDRDYFAYIKGGKLLLTHALTLESRTDTGNYVKGEDTLGVARVVTTVTDVKNPASVEYMGTLFYLNEENKERIETNAYKLTDLSKLGAGNGYMADVYGISADTATIYAVNYYKFYGINGVVFSKPIEIGYSKSTAKTVEYTE